MRTENALFRHIRDNAPIASVGILNADLMALGAQIDLIAAAGVEILHLDIIDGCFCPGMTVGPPFVKSLRTSLLKDVHLMVKNPLPVLADFVNTGASILTVQYEACEDPYRFLQVLGDVQNDLSDQRGLLRGIALSPGTPISVLLPLLGNMELVIVLGVSPGKSNQRFSPNTDRRINEVRRMAAEAGADLLVGVDGGVTRDNIQQIAQMKVDLVAFGSAVFDGNDPAKNASYMLQCLRKGRDSGSKTTPFTETK